MHTEILPIRALKDNYIWCIINRALNSCIIVDPGEARPVIDFLTSQRIDLMAILITHHHADHTGGVAELEYRYQPEIHMPQSDPKTLTIAGFPAIRSFAIPGHTLDHVAYFLPDKLFCGDTLFSAGCGRLFEGSYEQLYQSLKTIASLPDQTMIYCAHEYTLNNLRFAACVEPGNPYIQQAVKDVELKIKAGQPSLPSTLAGEKKINPFLRCSQDKVWQEAEKFAGRKLQDGLEVFTALRKWKDTF